jgi:hypothetical protein
VLRLADVHFGCQTSANLRAWMARRCAAKLPASPETMRPASRQPDLLSAAPSGPTGHPVIRNPSRVIAARQRRRCWRCVLRTDLRDRLTSVAVAIEAKFRSDLVAARAVSAAVLCKSIDLRLTDRRGKMVVQTFSVVTALWTVWRRGRGSWRYLLDVQAKAWVASGATAFILLS